MQAVLQGATRTEIWARSGQDIDAFPAEIVMGVADLVDAALVGSIAARRSPRDVRLSERCRADRCPM